MNEQLMKLTKLVISDNSIYDFSETIFFLILLIKSCYKKQIVIGWNSQ